jgi:hypothetical protein
VAQVYFEDINEGDEIPQLKKNCSTQQLVLWAAGSGDFYQIHYDKDFAQGTGLKGLIVHGALKNAFLGQLLHDWVGEQGQVRRFGCSYRGMDEPNQDILGPRHAAGQGVAAGGRPLAQACCASHRARTARAAGRNRQERHSG